MEKIAEKIKFHGVVREEVDTADHKLYQTHWSSNGRHYLVSSSVQTEWGVDEVMVFAANAKGERLGYPSHFGSIAESYPATFSEESHRTIVEEAIHNSFVDTKINYEELNYMIDCMSHYASTFGRDMNRADLEMHESICKSLNEAKENYASSHNM